MRRTDCGQKDTQLMEKGIKLIFLTFKSIIVSSLFEADM